MKKDFKKYQSIFIRYFILILILSIGFSFFYSIFGFSTIYSVYFLLNLFFDVSLSGATILIEAISDIEIIGACIGGAAYSLLLILNLATPEIKLKKRILMLATAFLSFLIINVFRIFILSILFHQNSVWFHSLHIFFWYFFSTVLILIIWFSQVRYFKIKKIPVYSDLKFFYEKSILGK